jgi:kumamolisin
MRRKLIPVIAVIWLPAVSANAQPGLEAGARLSRHVLPVLEQATRLPRSQSASNGALTLTIALNLSDPDGFDAFMKDFEEPSSPNYQHLISGDEFAARFGPTQEAYDQVLGYLRQQGFSLAHGSENRLTITVTGARSQAERAFGVSIDDYQLGDRVFYANDTDPAFPKSLAPLVRSVTGLSNLAQHQPHATPSPLLPASYATAYNAGGLPSQINGAGQTIGLIEYDNFVRSDVSNWIAAAGLPPNLINQVTTQFVNGGTGPSGCNPLASCGESEVLLDIDAVLGIAPGANIIVFVAPQGTDDIDMVNAAVNGLRAATGGYGGILSMSWGKCERELSDSEVDSMETLLKAATASGITLFASSGDNGLTCVDPQGRYANRVSYPALEPHAVAVGGTSLQVNLPGNTYVSESWWNGSADFGGPNNGGYGYSWHFGEPSYQAPFVAAPGRSVPDVSADAGDGIYVCQAYGGISPNCGIRSFGTSFAAPLWAGIWALASQERNLAAGYPGVPAGGGYLYTIPQAFRPASSMTGPGNDFAHVGLGSPNITSLVANVAGRAQITAVSPDFGSVAGGDTVTITGHGFIGVSQVLFGNSSAGTPAASFKVISESQIQAVTPSCLAASCANYGPNNSIVVVTPAGNSLPSQVVFRFLPVVTGVTPNSGTMFGGDTVTVSGAGFYYTGGQTFTFGGVPAVNVTCSNSTTCVMATPAVASAGPVDVLAGGSPLHGPGARFNYLGLSITRISPTVGPQGGNINVDIFGVSLSNKMIVKFGSTQTEAPGCVSNTWCSVQHIPPGTGSVPVTITYNGMTAQAPVLFTYEPFPEGKISPDHGPDTGGTVVTVTGRNFNPAPGGTQFVFSFATGGPDRPATNVSCASTSVCTLTTPPCDNQNFCSIQPYAVIKATANGLTNPIAPFTYILSSPPPPPPPTKGPPCTPHGTNCQ